MRRLKVVAVSSNTNAFGLRNMVMIGDFGEAWEAAANYIHLKPKDTVFHIPDEMDVAEFLTSQNFEIPNQLSPYPPAKLVRETFA